MKGEIELHQRENNEISENHLKDNGEKFQRGCVFVLQLLYKGYRLNARQLEVDYNLDGRRLRDVFANRKDVVREWVKGADGKTKYMEYRMEFPKPPTKQQVITHWDEVIQKELFI